MIFQHASNGWKTILITYVDEIIMIGDNLKKIEIGEKFVHKIQNQRYETSGLFLKDENRKSRRN